MARSSLGENRTLLVGMGNVILGDDGIGVRLVRDLAPQLKSVAGLTILEEFTGGGFELLDAVAGYEQLILVDSIELTDGDVGCWHMLSANGLRPTMHLRNVHDINLATALELGRQLGIDVPDGARCHILAVEIRDARTFSSELSPELDEAYPHLLEAALASIRELLSWADPELALPSC